MAISPVLCDRRLVERMDITLSVTDTIGNKNADVISGAFHPLASSVHAIVSKMPQQADDIAKPIMHPVIVEAILVMVHDSLVFRSRITHKLTEPTNDSACLSGI